MRTRLNELRNLDVDPIAQPLIYSGPMREHKIQTARNKTRALDYALCETATTLELTSRGYTLERYSENLLLLVNEFTQSINSNSFIMYEWNKTSLNFSLLARGRVRAFIAGSGAKDICRKTELPGLIENSQVQSINGISRLKLLDLTKRKGPNHAYRVIALAGVKLDFEQAARTGDRILLENAFEQQHLYSDQLKIDRGQPLDISSATISRIQLSLSQRAEIFANKRHKSIQNEARRALTEYLDYQVQQNKLTPEQVHKLTQSSKDLISDPHKTFRLAKLANLKLRRLRIMQSPYSKNEITSYLNDKLQYQMDWRALRQANGQRFAAADPTSRSLTRAHVARSMQGHARLREKYRDADPREFALARANLTENLEKFRMRDLAGPRIKMRPTSISTSYTKSSHANLAYH